MEKINKKTELGKEYINRAKDRLEAAEILFENNKFDDVISRAYYSVFHSIKAMLVIVGEESTTHKGLFFLFYKLFIETNMVKKELGHEISKLFSLRNEADYGVLPDKFSEEDAFQAINLAKEVLEIAEKFVEKSIQKG